MCAVSFRFDIACERSNVGDAVVFIICHVRLLHPFLDVHDHDDLFAPMWVRQCATCIFQNLNVGEEK